MTKKSFLRAFRDSLPIMAGYLALGIGYGVLLQSKGYSFWWAILMSVTMFAGGLLRWAVSRRQGEGAASVEGVGTLFSAGLVAGEGLCGIILAILALS